MLVRTVGLLGGAVAGALVGGVVGQILAVNIFDVSYEASAVALIRDDLPAALTVLLAVVLGAALGWVLVRILLSRPSAE